MPRHHSLTIDAAAAIAGGGGYRMDAAAPRAEPKPGMPLIPPNYVSLRHLQELRLKEKEEQRQREEEAAARRVREEQQQREKETSARKVKEEERKREEKAAARRVKEAAAAPKPEMKPSSNTSFRHKERSRGGQRFVVVAQRPPPPHGDGTVKKKDVGAGAGYRGEKGPDGEAANAPHGGGRKAENKGKGKVSADMKGEPGEPATVPSRPEKPEDKRKVEALGDQGTESGTSDAPGKPAEAAISSSRRSVRTEHKPKGKKGSGGWSTRTATTSGPTDAPPTQAVKSANKGKKKPLEGRCTDMAPISDLPDGKSLQPLTATEDSMNRRRRGGQGINPEAKSEVPEKKQPVVEVKSQPRQSAEGISNNRSGSGQVISPEAKSEGLEKKQTVVEVKTQPRPSAEGSSNQSSSSGQGTTQETKSEGLGEKQAVVMMRPTAWRMPRAARSSAWQRSGGGRGNGAVRQHDMVWMPKPVVVPANTEVE